MIHSSFRSSPAWRGLAIGVFIAGGWSLAGSRSHAQPIDPAEVSGVVAGVDFTPTAPGHFSSSLPSRYQSATVCADANDNGTCDPGEPRTATDADGAFVLSGTGGSAIVAEISTSSTNAGRPVAQRVAFRAVAAQAASGTLVVSALSTEIARMMDQDAIDFATARQKLAKRLDVAAAQVTSDLSGVADDAARASLLQESVILTSRFTLAAKMVDRHDVSPDALRTDPSATGPAIGIKEAQQASMFLEAIPRYDHIFVIVNENKATTSIKNSPFAPKINAYLNAGNQLTSYFATGNPSEPNRVAIAAADDFGITDDSAWNCVPAGDTADLPDDPLPAGLGPCTNAANHNIKTKPNLLSALANGGMTWRVYNESMNPGRDWRLNSAGNNNIVAADHLYPADSPVGAIGTPGLMLRMPGSLYATKHNESVNFQAVRSAPDFVANNRTLGGGQWDEAMRAAGTPPGWDFDQFGTDLARGDLANVNFVEPDQCDDMHGVTVQGTVPGSTTLVAGSDCAGGGALIFRGDNYTDALVRKIQASSVWTNTEKRSAIVLMFDEGTATTGFNSCCGWNPSAGPSVAGASLGSLIVNPDGTVSVDPLAHYNQGNKGHGTSIYGILTNQPLAPKHVVDSDAHSHVSFVRTMQDMFGLSDPGDDSSYMNRSKYTEKFVAANLSVLPEYANSADGHFDAVRPMNHAFVIPDGYQQKSGFVTPPGPQIGRDANQLNAWALRFDPPRTTATASPAANAAGWNRTDVNVSLLAVDGPAGPGVGHVTFSIAGAQATPRTDIAGAAASLQVTAEGTSTVSFFGTGALESVEPIRSVVVRLDKTAPSVTTAGDRTVVESLPGGAVVTYAAPTIVESLSGLASSGCDVASGSVFPVGSTVVTCSATDVAGNTESKTFTVTVDAAPDGSMSGSGHIDDDGLRHKFDFDVSQSRLRDGGSLDYSVEKDRFESSSITGVVFSSEPGVSADEHGGHGGHDETADSVLIAGAGKWNGRKGYTFEARATAHDGSGRQRDTFSIVVKDPNGVVVSRVDGPLDGGNIHSTRSR